MFYSHQLLARKAPLGQIWMAATMHAKINRKKLNKLNIIQICEEILNPSVPMALRLSGILMGGVVIVYERKVKLLYDDVTRLLIEINGAWRVKAAPDPTVLPKGKTHARKEAVTLPENQEADFGDIEQTLNYSYAAGGMEFQQTTYIAMQLDDLEEPHFNTNPGQDDVGQSFHQVDINNITLFEYHGSYQTNTETYDRFERFDIEGDDETQMNFNSREDAEIPATLIPSPPQEHNIPRGGDETPSQQPQEQQKQDRQVQDRQGPVKRKPRRTASSMMDYEQTIIPGHIYQSWLQDASDIVSRGGKKRKARGAIMSTTKRSKLINLPPTLLTDQLFTKGNGDMPYPQPLQELWSRSAHPLQNAVSESPPADMPAEESPPLQQERLRKHDQTEYHFVDFSGGFGSQNMVPPTEKRRTNDIQEDVSIENLMARVQANLVNNDFQATETNVMVTPGYSGDDVRSIPSSASGLGAASSNSEINSKRSNKRKPSASSGNGNIGLEPVAEDIAWHHPDPNFELSSLPENDLTADHELLVETGPTQTQHPVFTHSDEKITESIQRQMKTHFETPGSTQVESLNKLTIGMNRKAAAMLFYQTCVLATREVLRVEQRQPYGDILIARGPKM